MPRISSFIATLFLFQFTTPLAADEIDDFVQAQMKEQHIPGLSVAVVRNGEVIKAKGYGYANLEHMVPAKAETVYQSGSVGKQFTATAVMMLVEEGKLALDDPISKFLDPSPESWKDITVRHLLTHTSGITNYTSTVGQNAPEDGVNFRLDYTEAELVKNAAAFPLDFAPGEKWSYSNTGYVLLGVIIRKASGGFYGDFLKQRVFEPLGMATARVITEEEIIPNRAAGYLRIGGKLRNQGWVSPTLNTTADGSLMFTVLDMAKWDAALYTEKLLKQSSLEQMWTPVKLNGGKTHPYGFGWMIKEVNGRREIEHGGRWQGFAAAINRYPDDKVTVVVLTNLVQAEAGKIARGVAGMVVPALQE